MRWYPSGHGFRFSGNHQLLNKIKYPYNVNRLTQQEAIHMIEKHYQVQQWVNPCSTNVPVSCRNSRSLLAADVSILPMPISF